MKKTLIATALLLVTATVAMANPGFGERGLEAMKSALGLSDEQATQVEAIMQNERARMDAIRQETAANLQSVMTAEQFARYQEMHQRRGRGGPGGPEGRKGMRDQWQSRQQQN